MLAVEARTRREGEDDFACCRRAGNAPIGHPVKLADLAGNADIIRITEPGGHDMKRLERYRLAQELLRSIVPTAD